MKDFQIIGFLISISSILFFISNFLQMKKNISRYKDKSITLKEFKNNQKAFINSSIFSVAVVFVGGTLFLVGI